MIRAEEHETPTGETLFIFGCFNKFCHGHLEYLDGIPVGILVAQWRRTPYEAAEAWNHGEFE